MHHRKIRSLFTLTAALNFAAATILVVSPSVAIAESLTVHNTRGLEILYQTELAKDTEIPQLVFDVETEKGGALKDRKVALLDRGNNLAVVQTADTVGGKATFKHVTPGSYQLSLLDRCDDLLVERSSVTAEELGGSEDSEIAELVLRDFEEVNILAENSAATNVSRRIEVILKRSSGDAAKDLNVRLVRSSDSAAGSNNGGSDRIIKTVKTDSTGVAVFRNVPAGNYRIEPTSCAFLVASLAGASEPVAAAGLASGAGASGGGAAGGAASGSAAAGSASAASVGPLIGTAGVVAGIGTGIAILSDRDNDRPAVSPF